jgi:hypothetical protein
MNESKKQKLFASAKTLPTAGAPFNFHARVVAAVRRETRLARPPSIFETLAALFPRLVALVFIIIALCATAEFYFFGRGDYTQIAEQWVFDAE